MNDIEIRSKIGNFKVCFVSNLNFIEELLRIPNYMLIVGQNVYRIYKNKIFDKFEEEKVIVCELTEEKKTLETAAKIYRKLIDVPAKKNLTIASFGGGVNGDVAGFVASTLYRGVNWIYVPTTLLAMADSSVGFKTGLNFNSFKNIIGTFYPPSKVYINVSFLKTLKPKDFYSGLGEVIKLLLMAEGARNKLTDIVEKTRRIKEGKRNNVIGDIIREVIKIKLGYMEGDEFDRGRRNLLNYGHEFGHALESSSWFAIPHGIAILIGIIFANYVSLMRGWMDKKTFDYLNKELILPNIPQDVIRLKGVYFDKKILLDNIKKDKKRASQDLVLVLPSKNFLLKKIEDLSVDEFGGALKELRTILKI